MTEITAPHASARGAGASPSIATALLDWYDQMGRDLPWRVKDGRRADPYRVWLSEVMLQQTTVKAVTPYFERFLARWPTVAALAAAPRDDVLKVWAGLGYYARARNLHRCAQAIVTEHGGRFPMRATELAQLPGIGAYTAAAIAAIAFDEPATPVDGNIERVVARLFAIETPLPAAKVELRRLAETLTPVQRAGDYAQAMMDLGATLCTPRKPSCMFCPLERSCRARQRGIEAVLQARAPKPEKPQRYGTAFVVLTDAGEVLLRRRSETGLLAGMQEIPTTAWGSAPISSSTAMREAPVLAEWWPVPGPVTHVFTHFRLELTVLSTIVPADTQLMLWARQQECRWVPRARLSGEALPSLMRKVIAHAFKASR